MIPWQWTLALMFVGAVGAFFLGRWWRGWVAWWCEDCGEHLRTTHSCPPESRAARGTGSYY